MFLENLVGEHANEDDGAHDGEVQGAVDSEEVHEVL